PFTHGFEVHFERATLQYEFAVVGQNAELLMPLTVYDADGNATRPELEAGDPLQAFYHEVEEVRRSVAENTPSPILSGAYARDAIVLCHRQTESVQSGRPVAV